MADLILAGKKTQTRRIRPPRHKVGSRQPIQCGYRCKALGYIIIDAIREQSLNEMTLQEAEAEGKGFFKCFLDYWDYIEKVNKTRIDFGQPLTVYEFHLDK